MLSHTLLCVLLILNFCLLTSWNLPSVSRQQNLPKNYEKQVIKLKESQEEKKEIKKQKKEAFKERQKFAYLAHQKNRLAYFAERDGFICFDDPENRYSFFLSNFYPTSVKIWNMKFSCAEAALQAAKFLDRPDLATRLTSLDGEAAWKLAQRHSYQQRKDWYQVRENIMLNVLRAKFRQHPNLQELLIATGDAYLVANSQRDVFWADGGDGKGQNRLGHLLMQLRGELGGMGVVHKPAKYKKMIH